MRRVDIQDGPYEGVTLNVVTAGGLYHGMLVARSADGMTQRNTLLLAALDLHCELPVLIIRPEEPSPVYHRYNLHGFFIDTRPTNPFEVKTDA